MAIAGKIECTARMSRRSLLASAGAGALTAWGGSWSTPAKAHPATLPTPGKGIGTERPLDEIARDSGRRFGSVIRWSGDNPKAGSIQNPRYADLVRRECSLVVPENEMKWQRVRPSVDEYDFSRMDEIVGWARESDLSVRGHTLLWHRPEWSPEWLNNYDFGARPVQEAERIVSEHIRTVAKRYKGTISSHDVLNEAIDHDRNAPIETSLSRAMGSPEAVLDLAFHTARDVLPKAELVYNDYMSWEPGHEGHRNDVLRLLEGFRKRDVPVDTLGIQSHLAITSIDPATGLGPYDEKAWINFVDEAVSMGYRLMITEFDVKDTALAADPPRRDAAVAEYARRYFDVMLSYPQLTDILGWGMVDGYSWLQSFAPREDGLEVRGCLYDSNYRMKPVRNAIARSLQDAADRGSTAVLSAT